MSSNLGLGTLYIFCIMSNNLGIKKKYYWTLNIIDRKKPFRILLTSIELNKYSFLKVLL